MNSGENPFPPLPDGVQNFPPSLCHDPSSLWFFGNFSQGRFGEGGAMVFPGAGPKAGVWQPSPDHYLWGPSSHGRARALPQKGWGFWRMGGAKKLGTGGGGTNFWCFCWRLFALSSVGLFLCICIRLPSSSICHQVASFSMVADPSEFVGMPPGRSWFCPALGPPLSGDHGGKTWGKKKKVGEISFFKGINLFSSKFKTKKKEKSLLRGPI